MKILLLGATGRTGLHIIRRAAERGHVVVAIARDRRNLNDFEAEVVEGSPYDYETLRKAIHGCDALINTLNISRKSDNPWSPLRAPEDLISRSASNAIRAMEEAGIRRFVALSTIGAGRSWKTSPAILRFIVSVSNLKFAFRDHGRQEEVLEASSMDFTICRAPMLTNDPHEAGATATPEGEKPASRVLSRDAAARFFLDIIEKGQYIRQTISLSNRPSGGDN